MELTITRSTQSTSSLGLHAAQVHVRCARFAGNTCTRTRTYVHARAIGGTSANGYASALTAALFSCFFAFLYFALCLRAEQLSDSCYWWSHFALARVGIASWRQDESPKTCSRSAYLLLCKLRGYNSEFCLLWVQYRVHTRTERAHGVLRALARALIGAPR